MTLDICGKSVDSFLISSVFAFLLKLRRRNFGGEWLVGFAFYFYTCDKDSISLPILSAMLSYAA